MQAFRRERENFDAGFRDADRVLELRGERAVARHRRPAVGKHLHVRAAEIDHRLDGEEHAGLEHRALALAADVNDVRLVVEEPADAVAAKIAHDAHVVRLDHRLDGGADVADHSAGADRGDAGHHRLIGDLDETFGAARHLAHEIHAARIAVPAVEHKRHVDVDDVALAQRLVVGNAVADHVVDRGADRLAVAAIHQRRRQRAVIAREFEYELVELFGGDARPHLVDQKIEHFGDELARPAHAGKALRPVQLDLPGLAQGRGGGFDVAHDELPAPNVRDRASTRKDQPSTGIGATISIPSVEILQRRARSPRRPRPLPDRRPCHRQDRCRARAKPLPPSRSARETA